MKTGYAIELLFDEQFDSYVRSLWNNCRENSLSNHIPSIKGDVMPHITLSMYEDVTEEKILSLFSRYKNVHEKKACFQSGSVCMFKKTNVTYLNVNVNRDMLNYFENVYHFFVEMSSKCSPYFLPYVIVPHVSISIGKDLEDAKKCWNHIVDLFEPQQLVTQKIALVKLIFDDEHKLIECELIDEKDLED